MDYWIKKRRKKESLDATEKDKEERREVEESKRERLRLV